VRLAAHKVEVREPTGAGDSFCATFLSLIAASGFTFLQAMERANAAGALAVTRVEPMEGDSNLTAVEALLASGQRTASLSFASSFATIGRVATEGCRHGARRIPKLAAPPPAFRCHGAKARHRKQSGFGASGFRLLYSWLRPGAWALTGKYETGVAPRSSRFGTKT
jgi:hypothetical protein